MTLPSRPWPPTIGSLVVNGHQASAELIEAVSSADIEWPLDAAPTLTVKLQDELRRWSRSPLFSAQTEVTWGEITWVLAAINKTGPTLTLTFEHKVTAVLRRHISPVVSAPGTLSRLDFARTLVVEKDQEHWIDIVVPLDVLAKGEPASSVQLARGNVDLAQLTGTAVDVLGATATQADQQAGVPSTDGTDTGAATSDGSGGLSGFGNLLPPDVASQASGLPGVSGQGTPPVTTPPGAGAAATQAGTQADEPLPTSGLMTATQAAEAAIKAGFSGEALIDIVAIGGAESGWKVDATGNNSDGSIDRGWTQINSVHTQYDPQRLLSDPVYAAQAAWDISGGGSTDDTGASFYQWSTFDPSPRHPYNNGRYREHLAEATAATQAAQAAAPSGTVTGTSTTGSETAQKPESTWDALHRIFTEIQWRVFVRGIDELWISPDWGLYQAGPGFVPVSIVAQQGDPSLGDKWTAVTLVEGAPGVDTVDFNWDVNLRTATATATVRVDLWVLWPGQAAALPDVGPATGTWLIQNLRHAIGTPQVNVDVVQPQPALPEPTPTPGAVDTNSAGGSDGTTSADAGTADFIWPCHARVAQAYGENGHPGIDIGCPDNTPIYASADGTVRNTVTGIPPHTHQLGEMPLQGYGNSVFLLHGNDIGTIYGHLMTVLVAPGDKVNQGDLLGYSDTTGWATGPHLHFEFRKGANKGSVGVHDDPAHYVAGSPDSKAQIPAGAGGTTHHTGGTQA